MQFPKFTLFLVSIGLIFSSTTIASVPMFLTHQGKIIESDATPLSGVETITFSIYDTNDSAQWSDEKAITFNDGYYTVVLGPIPEDIFDGNELFLGVQIGNNDEMTPKHRIISVPYAIMSGHVIGTVDAQGGLLVNGQEIINDNRQWLGEGGEGSGIDADLFQGMTPDEVSLMNIGGTEGVVPKFSQTGLEDSRISETDGNIGIDTQTPEAKLHVNGTIKAKGMILGFSDTCDSQGTGMLRYNGGIVEVCNGTSWNELAGGSQGETQKDGTTQQRAGLDCEDILSNGFSNGDSVYWIDPTGGSTGDAFEAYCDMTTDGGGWTLVWSYKIEEAINDFASFWDSIKTATTSISTDVNISSIGSAFDTVIPNPEEGHELLLTCTSQNNLKTLLYQDVNASRLVSPSYSNNSCAEQGNEITCHHSSENFGDPAQATGFTNNNSNAFPIVVNRENPNTGYRFRWGVGQSTWNVKWGVDQNDNEFDCGDQSGSMPHNADDYWAVFVRNNRRSASCLEIKQKDSNSEDGIYEIDPDGSGSIEPFNVYCDMTTSGGGWTRVGTGDGNIPICSYEFALGTADQVANGTGTAWLASETVEAIPWDDELIMIYSESNLYDIFRSSHEDWNWTNASTGVIHAGTINSYNVEVSRSESSFAAVSEYGCRAQLLAGSSPATNNSWTLMMGIGACLGEFNQSTCVDTSSQYPGYYVINSWGHPGSVYIR